MARIRERRITGRTAGSLAAAVFLLAAAGARPAAGAGIGSGQLLIAGTELVNSPESQTVPFDTPTIVETRREDYDPRRSAAGEPAAIPRTGAGGVDNSDRVA